MVENLCLRNQLDETSQKLREETQRRMAAEAEVLKISEMERLRFSIELHDDICQRLAAISMFCKSFIHNPSPQAFLPELSALIEETLARTRHYAHESYPSDLDARGLKESLAALCRLINQSDACRCDFSWQAPEQSPFTAAQDLHIYRIVQEALHNALQYAGASLINVLVHSTGGNFSVCVQDNGSGAPCFTGGGGVAPNDSVEIQQFIKGGGLGLRSMRYRARQLGGGFIFETAGQGGTRVKITIPLRETTP